ncbi:MAG TPA: cysteine--tRNA ligase [Planctomycetota bacterium]|nr:cysteine--tRNA ligase [Planctomycetota bacterium]
MFKLYNTLTRAKDEFAPIAAPAVGLYTCGPTVYNFAHIGNLRTYVFEDVLRRALARFGFKVKHVMNITDVGHLTSDADTGEDKMELGARREGKTAWDIARFYTEAFTADCRRLNVLAPDVVCKATDHIPEMIALVRRLEEKGVTYRLADGIYFDTSKFPAYGAMARLDIDGLEAGARVEMVEGKRNPTDFALWKFSPKDKQRQMEWDAPWGRGFPGWHIECSAMSMKHLGEQIDIHCGAVDHIAVHHTNEIAQSEAATGKSPWVRWWVHGEFLVLDKGKMAKSGGGFITLDAVIKKGFDPLAYRYFLLQAHYRSQLMFSWEGLEAAANGYRNLRETVLGLKEQLPVASSQLPVGKPATDNCQLTTGNYGERFDDAVADDLNMPRALGTLWEALKDGGLSAAAKLALVAHAEPVLGLGLDRVEAEKPAEVPADVAELAERRAAARKSKDFAAADVLRKELAAKGYEVEDRPGGKWLVKRK